MEKTYLATVTAYRECGNKFTLCLAVQTDDGLIGVKLKTHRRYSPLSEEERRKNFRIGNTHLMPEKLFNECLKKQKRQIIRMPLNIAWAQ